MFYANSKFTCFDNMNLSYRNGLSADSKKISFAEMMTDDEQISREERCFRLWINSLGISSYVNNMFEDVRNGWVSISIQKFVIIL